MATRLHAFLESIREDFHLVVSVLLFITAAVVYVLHFFHVAVPIENMLMIILVFVSLNSAHLNRAVKGLNEKLERISANAQQTFLKNLRDAQSFVDPRLLELYPDLVRDTFENALACLGQGGIRVTQIDVLPIYYRDTLKGFKKCTFLAVASANPGRDFLRRGEIYAHMEKFIREERGEIKRVFIVKDAKKLQQKEREIIQKHVNCGVEVRIIGEGNASPSHRLHFLVEDQGRFAIKAEIQEDKVAAVKAIPRGHITFKEIDECLDIYRRLLESSQPFIPEAQGPGSG